MNYTEKQVTREEAQAKLERAKREEKKTPLYMKRLNKNTVIYCRREEKIKDYEYLYKKKITLDEPCMTTL